MRKYILSLILGCGIVLCSQVVYAQTVDKKTILDIAELIKNFTPEQLDKYITKSVDANVSDKDRWTALMLAAVSSSDPEVVARLIDKTTNVDTKNGAFLVAAVFNQNPKVVTTLIDKITDINVKDSAGITLINNALHFAASYNKNPEVTETLLKHGADIESRDDNVMTPLMCASRDNENPEVIETLLKYGADIGAESNFGPPLRYAPQNKNPKIAELLKKHTIEIIKVYDCPNEEYHHVCGILQNKTPSEQEAKVYIHYYDKNGMKIYKADSPTVYLDPFGKAKFRAFSFSNGNADDFDNYKVELKIRPGSGAEFY